MSPLLRLIALRLGAGALTLLAASALIYLGVSALPGDAATARLANLLVEIAGASGGVPGDIDVDGSSIDVLTTFYNARPATIYGGSNEIQRNILASAVLQLPS